MTTQDINVNHITHWISHHYKNTVCVSHFYYKFQVIFKEVGYSVTEDNSL